jgi:hypothetical protein
MTFDLPVKRSLDNHSRVSEVFQFKDRITLDARH